MKTSHKLILALCKSLMVFSASIFVISTILLTAVLRPEQIKQWAAGSGLYEVSAREIQSQIKQNFPGSAVDSPIVDKALRQTITPEEIQTSAEKGIESSFTWLNRQGDPPEFNLNEAEIRTTLADKIVTALRLRAAQLPTCSSQNPPPTTDIFTINCLPPGTDVEAQLAQVRTEITQSNFIDTSQNTTSPKQQGATEKSLATNQDIISQLQDYRQAYQWLQIAPVIASLLFIVSTIITLIFIKPKYRILRTLSVVCIPQAVLYLIAGLLTPHAIKSSSNAILNQTASTPFVEPVKNITLEVTQAISSSFIKAGVIIGATGVVLLLIYIIANNKFKPEVTQPTPLAEPSNSKPSSL